jgi:hypothetical protein
VPCPRTDNGSDVTDHDAKIYGKRRAVDGTTCRSVETLPCEVVFTVMSIFLIVWVVLCGQPYQPAGCFGPLGAGL